MSQDFGNMNAMPSYQQLRVQVKSPSRNFNSTHNFFEMNQDSTNTQHPTESYPATVSQPETKKKDHRATQITTLRSVFTKKSETNAQGTKSMSIKSRTKTV